MKHDELLAKIDSFSCCSGAHELALRAVVELHKPELVELKSNFKEDYSFTRCSCAESFYPCPTIEAIAKELE